LEFAEHAALFVNVNSNISRLVPIAKTVCILRLRHEMNERLRKEEEERVARRKRVEAIMLRTRGKGSTPSSTPTKVLIDIIIIITLHHLFIIQGLF
jgi:hypothetical protein